MAIQTFVEQVKVQGCNAMSTAIADGKFPASASFIDVADFERFAFVVKAGALDSALTLQVEQATAANGTPKDVDGATLTIGTGDDNDTYVIEVETRKLDIANDYRYVTLDVTGQAGSDDFAAILFLGMNPGSAPVTQPATTNTVVVAG
jgi:hypothetical protein